MKNEIETRFLEIDKDALIARLRALGAEDKGEVLLRDTNFYNKELTWREEGRMIRLRRRNERTTLTFKDNMDGGIDGAREIEFDVSDADEAREFIIEVIQLVPYRTVEKRRHTFVLDGVSFDIETWPKIPTYVEIEGDSIEALQEAVKKVGYVWDARCELNPRGVWKQYGYDFDAMTEIKFD
jgi:adenylate cyclase, class 2